MRLIACSAGLACVLVVLVATFLWHRHQNSPVPPTVYGSLFALQRMEPQIFSERLRAPLTEALKDGHITYEELAQLEALLPPMGPILLEAIETPGVLEPHISKPDSNKKEPGLGERFGSALDGLFDHLQRKYRDFSDSPSEGESPLDL